MALPNPCDCTYNGFTFPTETKTEGFSFRNVYDAAGRTVTHKIVSLKLRAKILSGAGQDASLTAIRRALERPGGQLTYSGRGLGEFQINTAGKRRDLVWGPRPQVLEWRPIGRDQAAEISWQVDVALIDCPAAAWAGQVMEAVYELTIATDHGGYATRTHSGLIRIPQTRRGVDDDGVPDSADNYFELFVPVPLENFERTITRTLDASASKLEFVVTDTERKGHYLPPNIVSAKATHNVTSEGKTVMIAWGGTISASYEIARNKPRSDTWPIFLDLVESRIRPERARGATFFATALSISEDLYTEEAASYSLSYRLIYDGKSRGKKNVQRVVPTSGLWRPTPNTDPRRWSDSLAANAQNPRGISGLKHNPNADLIIDLCSNVNRLRRDDGVISTLRGNGIPYRDQRLIGQWADIASILGVEDKPAESGTWIGYSCDTIAEPWDHTVLHTPLPKSKPADESILRSATYGDVFPSIPPYLTERQVSPAPIAQVRSSPTYYVRLIGQCIRFAYEPVEPKLIPVGRAKVLPANDPEAGTFWRQGLLSWSTHPIFFASWNLRWMVVRNDNDGKDYFPLHPHPYQEKDVNV